MNFDELRQHELRISVIIAPLGFPARFSIEQNQKNPQTAAPRVMMPGSGRRPGPQAAGAGTEIANRHVAGPQAPRGMASSRLRDPGARTGGRPHHAAGEPRLILLVLVNIAAVVLESVPALRGRLCGGVFTAIEIVSLVVFTLEYALRIWAAAEHAPYRRLKPLQARLRYMLSTDGLIDLVSVLPFWLAFVVPFEFRIILLLRIVRFLKLARYSPAMRSLLEASMRSGAPCSAASSSCSGRR